MRVIVSLVLILCFNHSYAKCHGKFTNPITDICWNCLFPMSIGPFTVFEGEEDDDIKNPQSPLCFCANPIPRPGFWVGFWEPIRMVDVVREPFCFPSLGGMSMDMGLDILSPASGSQSYDDSSTRKSNYQVHWYEYPALVWLKLITSVVCLSPGEFDLTVLTEYDPTWDDDVANFIISPEAGLFGNPAAQAACSVDCIDATKGKATQDKLFWCAGCQGSMYPLSGSVGNQVSAVQGSVLLTERLTYKLHRVGIMEGSTGQAAKCGTYKMPIMHKSNYKTQMTYPVTASNKGEMLACNPYGRSTVVWESMKSWPKSGEDFSYLIWRKRNCCAL